MFVCIHLCFEQFTSWIFDSVTGTCLCIGIDKNLCRQDFGQTGISQNETFSMLFLNITKHNVKENCRELVLLSTGFPVEASTFVEVLGITESNQGDIEILNNRIDLTAVMGFVGIGGGIGGFFQKEGVPFVCSGILPGNIDFVQTCINPLEDSRLNLPEMVFGRWLGASIVIEEEVLFVTGGLQRNRFGTG